MSPKLYRRMKEVLGSHKTGGPSPASNTSAASLAPQSSNTPDARLAPQTDDTSLDNLMQTAGASSQLPMSPPSWEYRLDTSDRWLFYLLARDTLPQGTTCDACANLSLLFTTGSRQPKRPSLVDSKNAVQHHGSLVELAVASVTCPLCALLLACFKGTQQGDLLEKMLRQEREGYFESIRAPSP